MPDPFIIMCAPNGARRQKMDHANIPLTAEELADCAEEILAAGACMMHLHVRNGEGAHSLSVDRYRDAIEAIKKRVGNKLVLQVTSEAVGIYSRAEQMAMVKELHPEAVSLALRELCPTEKEIASTSAFYTWMKDRGIFPQTILYDEGDAHRFERMRREGVFATEHPFVLYVLGKYSGVDQGKSQDLQKFTEILSAAVIPFAACGFETYEHNLAAKTAVAGGHVRVGFENNLRRPDGSLVSSNAELVQCAADQAVAVGRPIADADYVRQRFMTG